MLSVVPVLPATGRPTVPRTLSAVDQPPQLPLAGVSPVGHRAASVAARAASAFTTCRHRGLATSRCTPPGVVYVAGVPSRFMIALTGMASQ